MNFLSVDCDCDKNQTDPVMNDLGIIASLDPVANDQAFIDMIWASSDSEKLKERIDSRKGRHILKYAKELGRPFVIDCMIDNNDKVWPMVAPGGAIESCFTQEDLDSREEQA